MTFESWVLLIGALLLLMGLGSAYVSRLPVTTAIIYLVVGVALGPLGWDAIHFDLQTDASALLRAAEVTVVISLFAVGLKLRLPPRDKRWILAAAEPRICGIVAKILINAGAQSTADLAALRRYPLV